MICFHSLIFSVFNIFFVFYYFDMKITFVLLPLTLFLVTFSFIILGWLYTFR